MRMSPRRKPTATAVAQEKPPPSRSSSKAPVAAPPSQAAALPKSAPTRKAPAESAPAAKPEKTPSKAAPSKAAPSKSLPPDAAPAQVSGGRRKQAPGGRQPAKGTPKKGGGVAPKPRRTRRNENYKVRRSLLPSRIAATHFVAISYACQFPHSMHPLIDLNVQYFLVEDWTSIKKRCLVYSTG